jgi:hypothetical protein
VVFLDTSETVGQLQLELGDLYQSWGMNLPNSSPLFWLLQLPKAQMAPFLPENPTQIDGSLDFLEETKRKLSQLEIQRPDVDLVIDELALTIKLLQHACKRAKILLNAKKHTSLAIMLREIDDIKTVFAPLWLQRNRLGGLSDSLSRFDIIIDEYKSGCGSN